MKIVPALLVRQWLNVWDQVEFQPVPPRGKPAPHFYIFSMGAYDLRRLSGIYRRDPSKPPAQDIGIQRRHIQERSDEILKYIEDGFPLSRISKKKLVDQNEVNSLRMPGWLPTAVVANILVSSDKRGSKNAQVSPKDLIQIEDNGTQSKIKIPDHCLTTEWEPQVHPIEIIDGQHRLWALEEPEEEDGDEWTDEFRNAIKTVEIPVVAFHGLDRTWQAYLFYTINQLPKRIDTSLVFDLYPLLRTEEWLMRFEGPEVYRDTRAQDLTIILWSHPESPWNDRIMRHGGRVRGKVTQASFIRSLRASFVKTFDPIKTKVGGLFGSRRRQHELELTWAREQQAAFLIMVWQQLSIAVEKSKATWAEKLRQQAKAADGRLKEPELAAIPFRGAGSLLASDQGCRCIQQVMNDLFWLAHEDANNPIDLREFQWDRRGRDNDETAVSHALQEIHKKLPKAVKYAGIISQCLAEFDWRIFSAVGKDEQAAIDRQASYRGSGGYRLLRQNTLEHLRRHGDTSIAAYARRLQELLGFEEGDEE